MEHLDISRLLAMIEEGSVGQLRNIPKEHMMYYATHLTVEEFQEFQFAKNIKIFGGINKYVEDFFKGEVVTKLLDKPTTPIIENTIIGMIRTCDKMLTYDELSEHNRDLVKGAKSRLEGNAAPAAG